MSQQLAVLCRLTSALCYCSTSHPHQDAFKSYVRTRDYCTSPKHIMTMCLNAVRVAVEMNNFMHVTNYVSKAEQTPGTKVGG